MKSKVAQSETISDRDADGQAATNPSPGVLGSAIFVANVEINELTRAIALREAVVETGDPAAVGDMIDAFADGDDVVTVRFSAALEGYRGWRWSVTLSVLDADRPTVSEVVLLPGPEALLAPEWLPWEERVRSGDLGVGDLMPPAPDDDRIVPAYLQSDDPAVEDLAHEVGIGRVRVLSREGREDAAERWHAGDFGPDSEMARHAPGTCATCAFFVPLAGALRAGFGACTNALSPADGHVVDLAFGCGAHSEAVVDRPAASATGENVVDELRLEVFQRASIDVVDDVAPANGAGSDDAVAADGAVEATSPDANGTDDANSSDADAVDTNADDANADDANAADATSPDANGIDDATSADADAVDTESERD
ncbi:MAG: DUF3027 domain-containing protein [Nakamurella sp.]